LRDRIAADAELRTGLRVSACPPSRKLASSVSNIASEPLAS
jgi:hypothetical protein